MAEGRTQIVVSLIGVAGVIAAAMIANSDKLFGSRSEASAGTLSQRVAPGAASAAAALDSPVASATSVPEVDGWWHDNEGNRFAFAQTGTRYTFVQYAGSTRVGSGKGVLTGRDFTHSFEVADFGSGTCAGSVAGDGQSTSGHCSSPGKPDWDFTVTRGY